MDTDQLQKLAEAICRQPRTVVFTGAGVSTESGIPDFRGPDGVWRSVKPVTYQEFLASPAGRGAYWAYKTPLIRALAGVEPNPGHRAISRLFDLGRVELVVTQNIDGLHQASGIPDSAVVELHGNNARTGCLDCEYEAASLDVLAQMEGEQRKFPLCPQCGGDRLKPRTISFGQAMPEDEMARAFSAAEDCDVFLVVGSSLTVSPANLLPFQAEEAGAKLAIVNQGATPLDELADFRFDGGAGETLGELVRMVEQQQ
jgi:NAD-dependent deacetylase